MVKKLGACCFLLFVCGCAQIANTEDDGLRTVPVTNNPNFLPSEQNLMPMVPTQSVR